MRMILGRRIYADSLTGEILANTGEPEVMDGFNRTTIESDFKAFLPLQNRDPKSVIVIELEPGQYSEDFATCNGYHVNPGTRQLEFSYPDPNTPDPEPPVYQKPLTEQLAEVKAENESLKSRVSDVEMTITEILFS